MNRISYLTALCGFAVLAATPVLAQGYKVDVNDVLNLRAAMWDATDGEIKDLETITGSYVVGADGSIAMGLVGNIDVADMTTKEIALLLETATARYLRAGQAPNIAVEIEEYAPIYLFGEVDKPGVYEFSPGLTVLKAISIAGGLSGASPLDGEERNFLNARGLVLVMRRELTYLNARRARLLAEIAGDTELDTSDAGDANDVIIGENDILKRRNEKYEQELAALQKSQVSLREALEVLSKKLATNQAQLELGLVELEKNRELVEKRLVQSAAVFERERYVSELESNVLDIERTILAARQELQDKQRSETLLTATRAEENSQSLQDVNADIAEIETKIDAQVALMDDALGKKSTGLDIGLDATPTFQITRSRTEDGKERIFVATRATVVLPGDVVEVFYEAGLPETPSN
ncbi:MAG: polysaccharide biosynthesis/export family protein [Sulfitobacter sp.]